MGIQSHEAPGSANEAPQPTAEPIGSPGAVIGALDFLTLSSGLGIDRIDSTIEPYLTEVEKLVKDKLKSVEMVRLTKLNNAYAFKFNGPDGYLNFFGLYFASLSDPVSQHYYPSSLKLRAIHEELKTVYGDKRIRISDARVVFGGYPQDMERAFKMADTIVRTFQATSYNEVKNSKVSALLSNEFTVDWRISEARAVEDELSPHGVRPRMDVGMTFKAKIKNEHGREFREFENEYHTVGVIGGYTEIREKEEHVVNGQRVLLYRPVFNITVCNSIIPLEGVASIMLAAFAPTIYNTQFWAKQWADLTKGSSNPGHLEENPDNRGRPIELGDQDELVEFVRTYFAQPIIAFQFQDGRDIIPGMWRLGTPDPIEKNLFVNRLGRFYGDEVEQNASSFELAINLEQRFEGVYGDKKATLLDSRDIDYLWVAAHNGYGAISREMRAVLLGCSENPVDRATVIQNATQSFTPAWFTTVSAVNPEFIKWIVSKADASRLVIIDPNSRAETRSIGSYLGGFGSASGIGSIVSNGIVNRGLSVGSVWSNY
jgi:hypothetical protein